MWSHWVSASAECLALSVMRSAAEDARAMWVAVLVLAGALVAVREQCVPSAGRPRLADQRKCSQHSHDLYLPWEHILESDSIGRYPASNRVLRALTKSEQQSGCLYEGRWHAAGAAVRAREPCLACACGAGALSCRRRACAPLPAPPPRCHVIHRKGECCPELRCPDDVIVKQHSASARFDDSDIETPTSTGHACVAGGTVYSAGSAMSTGTACEQCFCLGGARRCVRPRCLPAPPGCRARAAPGACCPQRYHCDHATTPSHDNSHDCVTPEGGWAAEGERVKAAEAGLQCVQCFCLRGSVRCQHLSCAPALQGCRPLLQPGQCCPHQYQCDHHSNRTKSNLYPQRQNLLMSLRDEDRALHTSKSTKRETTEKVLTTVTDKSTAAVTVTKRDLTTTAKVKRQTEEPNITSSSLGTEKSGTSSSTTAQTTQKLPNSNEPTQPPVTETTILDESAEELSTELPQGSVKVIINGTINCTTELSSTSLLLNVSDTNDTKWIDSQTQPRIPIVNTIDVESHTFPPNDIITEGSYKEGFDENETFTINVTSSLRTNTSHSTTTTTKPSSVVPKTVPPALLGKVNVSKTKKDEYDYDYTEPTLPPSLPNLKIIPFVAADAVVEEDVSSKESLDYSLLDREDKFPVYYPNKEAKDSIYATRKEDVYNPTQYPIFISKKVEQPQYPSLTQGGDDVNISYPSITNDMPVPIQEYTVTASLGNSAKINYKGDNPPAITNTQFEVEPPAVNLFSPPVETEGGFVPKSPGIIDDYYSVYPSTPPGNIMPHLTTSMQLEPKDECISSDGRQVSEGESISLSCSICTCAWGELHCSPRPCNTPPGCRRKAASISTTDLCCGELICDKPNKTTSMPLMTTQDIEMNLNDTKATSKYEKVLFTYQDSTTTPRPYTNNDTVETAKGTNISATNERFENMIPVTLVTTSSTEKSVSHTTSTEAPNNGVVENNNHSLEYDEEEDDDEGFSLGSVLKLLLSDTYDTTTAGPKKKVTTVTTSPKLPKTTSTPVPTTKRKQFTSSKSGFIPVTHRSPYTPPKKLYPQNTINRIDHLVLGESNAIRKTTPKPTYKPFTQSTTRKVATSTKTTSQPITTKTVEISSKESFGGHPVEVRPSIPNFISGFGLGLPKLAGCNIYGRMYRVGRIIAELSSPCQECKCTELGVECRSLSC